MIRKIVLSMLGLGMLAAGPAMATSVSTSPSTTNNVVTSQVSTQSSQQTGGIIANAVSGAIGGGGGAGTVGTSFLNSRDAGRAGGAGDKRWGVFLQGAFTNIENNQAGVQFDGNLYNLVGGIDYLVNDRLVVGLALGYETSDIDTTFNRGTIESDGFTIAPYLGFSLSKNWSIDLSGGYSDISYDTTRNSSAVRGSFDGERWFVAANLNGNYAMNRWRLMPKVGVLYFEEDQDRPVETGAGAINTGTGSTVKLGRIYAGGRVGYAFNAVTPYVKLIGEYDFERPNSVAIGNGTFTNDDELGAQTGLGMMFRASNSVSGQLEASYDSLGRSDLDVYTISARMRVQF